jgi:hypothetical protein
MNTQPQRGSETEIGGALLQDLGGAIADTQSALLSGNLYALDSCIFRQRQLCSALRSFFLKHTSGDLFPSPTLFCNPPLYASVIQVRKQNRVLSAVLRRMQRNLQVMSNTLEPSSVEYKHCHPAVEAGGR